MTVGVSTILNTGRALMAALQPITGSRSVGTITMYAKPGTTVPLAKYTYLTPVVNGRRQTQLLFKAMAGPNEDDSWTITDTGTTVQFMSNIGGIRHNVPTGTYFYPDTEIENLVTTGVTAPRAAIDFEQGSNPPEYGGLQDMSIFETFDGPVFTKDLARSAISHFPAAIIAFQDFEPADGVTTATNDQKGVNAGTDRKLYKVTFSTTVITPVTQGDVSRRQSGLILADTITQLLNDKHQGDVGEQLSNPGGVQIRQMFRENGPQDVYQKFYMYTVLLSCMVTLERKDFRTYHPWLRSTFDIDKPQVPVLANQGPYTVVDDNVVDMTPPSLDLSIDGTFTGASTRTLWFAYSNPGTNEVLQAFTSGNRRVENKAKGVFLEPAITNDLGANSIDFSAWTPVSGATVATNTETDPLGTTQADTITFDDDEDSAVEFGTLTAAVGEPTTFLVWAKGEGLTGSSIFRLAIDDGVTENVSEDFHVGPTWTLFRFSAEANADVTLRVKNRADTGLGIEGQLEGTVVVWGASFSDTSRWGPQFTSSSTTVEKLDFVPYGDRATVSPVLVTPQQALSGSWALRWRSPVGVPPELLGTGTGASPGVLVSIGDGVADDLVTLDLIGTPSTGGAQLRVSTRSAGVSLTLSGVEWDPGAEITFTLDSRLGTLRLSGTLTHDDDTHSFDPYFEDAVEADDAMVVGQLSDGSGVPAPGYYIAIDKDV